MFKPLTGAFLAAVFLPAALLSAKEREPVITPSFAKPVQATIFLGGTIEIPLNANAPVHGTKYLLRSLPSKGRVDEIVTADDGLASIVYRNDPGRGIGTDTFEYAVQSPGAAVSSRATVTVKVINRPPHLEVSPETDFGRVPVGSTARQTVTLTNSGGEPFVSQVQLSPPWGCKSGRLEIPPGKSQDVLLEFTPESAGAFAGDWFLAGEGGAGVRLVGTAYVVLEVSPTFLKLQNAPDARRSAKLTVANKTGERVEAVFVCKDGLRPVSPVSIEGGGQAEVDVEADPSRPAGGRTSLSVGDKRSTTTVDVLVPPLPAKLELAPASLDFGELQAGKSAAREIAVSNSGGLPATVEIICPNWISPETTRLLVKPGEECKIRVDAVAARPGYFRDRILFKSGPDNIELVASAAVPDRSAPAAPAATPAAPPNPSINLAETRRAALRIAEISQIKNLVTVRWTDPSPARRTYRLEFQTITSESALARRAALEPDVGSDKFSPEEFAAERLKLAKVFEQASKNNRVVKAWVPLEKADLRESGNRTISATFPAPPGQQVVRIRISPVEADGSISPVKTEIRIPLVQPPQRRWPVMTITLTLVTLASLTVLARKRFARQGDD